MTIASMGVIAISLFFERYPMLRLQLFGGFNLTVNDITIRLTSAREKDLLAVLTLYHPRSIARKSLSMKLWPDSGEGQAMTNLRKCLVGLRQAIPESHRYLNLEDDELRWKRGAEIDIDVIKFRLLLQEGKVALEDGEIQVALEALAELYKGDFHVDCYDEWVIHERELLRDRFITVLERLSALYEAQRQYPEALQSIRRLLHFDRFREETYRHIMRLYASMGQITDVEQTYRTCVHVLEREFSAPPSLPTTHLFEQLMNAGAQPKISDAKVMPFVGRLNEWRTLQQCWSNVLQQGIHSVILTGEFGIGKTRLIGEMVDSVRRRGFITIEASCDPFDRLTSYAPVLQWLRNEAIRESIRRANDARRTELSRLLPDLASPSNGGTSESFSSGMQRARLHEALNHLFLSREQPLLLAIDNLHWCDDDTLTWLHSLLLHDRLYDGGAPILFIGAVCTSFPSAQPLKEWCVTLRQQKVLTEVEVSPFTLKETQQFAEVVRGAPVCELDAANLHRQSLGNPLLVYELLETESKLCSAYANQAKLSVRSKFELLLAHLPNESIQVLECGSMLGLQFTLSQLLDASCFKLEQALIGLDRLIDSSILRELEDELYRFASQSFQQFVFSTLSLSKRHLWQQWLGKR